MRFRRVERNTENIMAERRQMGDLDVKKAGICLCGIVASLLMTGCGAMPDLTQEETELISEYAVGVLLKYDKNHGSRLTDTSAYDVIEEEETPEELPEEPVPEEEPEESSDTTEIVDASQDQEEIQPGVSSVEEYYGIPNVAIQYTGYELTDSYPSMVEGEELFFSMDATPGTQLLVLKFSVLNTGNEDQIMNMLEYGARFRVSVNGGASNGALATMLLNDMQTYDDVIPAGSSIELVSIVEVPQNTSVNSIDFILRGNGENATLSLQ